MSSFLKKEALCVCKNKLVIVLDCGSSIYHVTIKMTCSRQQQIKFAQQSNNEIKQFIKINLNYCLNNAAAERKITEIS